MQEHFGVRVRPGTKYGLRLVREEYALINKRSSLPLPEEYLAMPGVRDELAKIFEDDEFRLYTDEHCATQRENAFRNFDLNMSFFSQLDHGEFESALSALQAKYPKLSSVTDLKEYDGIAGLYIMVLDDYTQAYVGLSQDIKRRVQAHWRASKEFDRLIWGTVESSILSIDSFRALDTTQIFALRHRNPVRIRGAHRGRRPNAVPPQSAIRWPPASAHVPG